VIAAILADPDDAPLQTLPSYSTAELRHLARTEQVVHLDDMLERRTSLAFIGAVTDASAAEVAAAIAPVLGWDAEARARQVERGVAHVHCADPTWTPTATTTSSPASR
jgi:glycerol-3-phosphate dehydrogenase